MYITQETKDFLSNMNATIISVNFSHVARNALPSKFQNSLHLTSECPRFIQLSMENNNSVLTLVDPINNPYALTVHNNKFTKTTFDTDDNIIITETESKNRIVLNVPDNIHDVTEEQLFQLETLYNNVPTLLNAISVLYNLKKYNLSKQTNLITVLNSIKNSIRIF